MNAKKCKALRRQARKESVGLPLRNLLAMKHRHTTQAVNDPQTFRGVYRNLKKAA